MYVDVNKKQDFFSKECVFLFDKHTQTHTYYSHRAVVMSANVNVKRERGQDVTVVRRSTDSNGKAKLAQALENVNCTSLYSMQSCEEMVACFYSTVTSMLDHYPAPVPVGGGRGACPL